MTKKGLMYKNTCIICDNKFTKTTMTSKTNICSKECEKIKKKRYRLANLDKIKEQQKLHYIKNKEKIKKKSETYRLKNRDKIKVRDKKYREKHPEIFQKYKNKIKEHNRKVRVKFHKESLLQNSIYKLTNVSLPLSLVIEKYYEINNNYLNSLPKYACGVCGKIFHKLGRQTYCSISCSNEASNRKRRFGSGNTRCKWCGKEFIKNNAKNSYCSIDCRTKQQRQTQRDKRRQRRLEIKNDK